MSKKTYNKNFKQTSEKENNVVIENETNIDSEMNEEIQDIVDFDDTDKEENEEEVSKSQEIENVEKTEDSEGIVETLTEPISMSTTDIDFTIEKKNKSEEEKELDNVITDIKNIIEPAVEEIDEFIENSKEEVLNEEVKEEEVKEVEQPVNETPQKPKTRKITFEQMFGYFWNGQNYNF